MKEPQVLVRERRALDLKAYRFTSAKEEDFSQLITQSTMIQDAESERVSIVYLELEDDCSQITSVLQRIQYEHGQRTAGMKTQSRIFGFRPRVTIRDDFCSVTALAHDDPQAHALIVAYAQRVSLYYRQYHPELYAYHQQQVTKVLPEWTLEDSVFTSGIINKNNPLPYHFDAGNFKNVWSNMLAFRSGTAGGYLSVPEYDVGFAIKNNSLLMFDGQNLLHGVTPIRMVKSNGYRYSIVYYSLQQMWNCLALDDEVIRIRTLRTQREEKRLARTLAKAREDEA